MKVPFKSSPRRVRVFLKKAKTATIKKYKQLTRQPVAAAPKPPTAPSTNPSSEIRNEAMKEPKPPSPATPLDFPRCTPRGMPRNQLDEREDLVQVFADVSRKANKKHLNALNLKVAPDTPLDQLLPSGYVPPLSWSHEHTPSEGTQMLALPLSSSPYLSNGTPIPTRKTYYDMVKELLYDKEDAFRPLRRQAPLPDRPPARIMYFRKFWERLMTVASFWDSSADNYFLRPSDDSADDTSQKGKSAMDIYDMRADAQRADGDEDPFNAANQARVNAANNSERKVEKYTGHRIGAGSEMPIRFLEDTLTTFVETICYAFRCKVGFPQYQHQSRLNLRDVVVSLLPVPGSVFRIPKDRSQAKKGTKEGPLLGIYVRHLPGLPREQLQFREKGDKIGEGKYETLDLITEVGVMLMQAQRRAREGKVESIPGTGKWWTTAPRFGGNSGGGLHIREGDTAIASASIDAGAGASKDKTVEVPPSNNFPASVEMSSSDSLQQPGIETSKTAKAAPTKGARPPQKKVRRTVGSWPDMQAPASAWEKNVKYQAVGKDWESDYEEVRHSFLRLRINCTNIASRCTSSQQSTTTFLSSTHASR